jgi:hypothetical protein
MKICMAFGYIIWLCHVPISYFYKIEGKIYHAPRYCFYGLLFYFVMYSFIFCSGVATWVISWRVTLTVTVIDGLSWWFFILFLTEQAVTEKVVWGSVTCVGTRALDGSLSCQQPAVMPWIGVRSHITGSDITDHLQVSMTQHWYKSITAGWKQPDNDLRGWHWVLLWPSSETLSLYD